MKILPRRITSLDAIYNSVDKNYAIVAHSDNKVCVIKGTPLSEADTSILQDLVSKHAYASTLLYFVENFRIDPSININSLKEDINILLHNRCKITEEQAPLLTSIKGYPIYESTNGVIRGTGKTKLRECFDLTEDVDIENITVDYLKSDEPDAVIAGFLKCPKCHDIFPSDALKFEWPNVPDDYEGPVDDEPIGYECPDCGYYTTDEENFSDAWVGDLFDAPNAEEFVTGINEYLKSLEEDGTQAADIASKVDYSFQSAPTPANPSKKKKFEAVEIKELDESTHLNLTGFIKDVDGLYKRGNYVLVRECDTKNLTVINKNRLNEVAEDIDYNYNGLDIVKHLKRKLDERFPDRFSINSGEIDEAFGIIITDKDNHAPNDLIDLTDAINAIMKVLGYDKTDYEIDYKKNNLIIAIYDKSYKHMKPAI